MIIKDLSNIKIMKSFQDTVPQKHKMEKCRQHWRKYGCQDRYIVINSDGYLIDGYIQYLVLKENNIDEAEVMFSDEKKLIYKRKPQFKYGMTTYVYGIHKNKSKEYVWRIPKSWVEDGRVNEVKLGDKIIVYTRYGFKQVTITRIETMSECPVNMTVYKVLGRVNNGE